MPHPVPMPHPDVRARIAALRVERVDRRAIHQPQPFAVRSDAPLTGEICRAQTPEKAERVRQALRLLDRYERGELIDLHTQIAAD